MINSSTIGRLQKVCDYVSVYDEDDDLSMAGASGFVVTDDGSDNGFFVDGSGYVTSIDLDDCSENWRVKISTVLGVKKQKLISRNGLSLFKDSSGNEGVLIGTPNAANYSKNCYILALYQDTGKEMFSIKTEANGSPYCQTNGFVVDNDDIYAYGGIMAPNTCNNPSNGGNCTYRGEVIKIDLDKGEIVNRWYSLPDIDEEADFNADGDYLGYIGAAPRNYPAIIDDYLIIGTGSLFKNPESVNDWSVIHTIFKLCYVNTLHTAQKKNIPQT